MDLNDIFFMDIQMKHLIENSVLLYPNCPKVKWKLFHQQNGFHLSRAIGYKQAACATISIVSNFESILNAILCETTEKISKINEKNVS